MTSLPLDRQPPIRVLHVDDDPDFVEMAAAFLEHEHDAFEVETATSADAGLDRLAAGDIDCIVSDFEMPGLDGLEFLRLVREVYPSLPFILFTGQGSETVASKAISAGVTEYLRKRAGTEQFLLLANRIEQAVSRARAERLLERGCRAMDLANDGIALLDDDGRFRFVNRRFGEYFGYHAAELVGAHWSMLHPSRPAGADVGSVEPPAGDGGRGGTTLSRKDGSNVVADLSVESTPDGGRICLVTGLSDRTGGERSVRRDARRFELLIDAVSEYAIFMLDTDGVVTTWNTGAERITGYARDEIMGEHFSTFFPADAAESGAPDELLARAREQESVDVEEWWVRTDGSEFWASVALTAIYDTDGTLTGFGTVARDLSSHRRRDDALRMEGRFLEAALNSLDDVFYVVDTDFDFCRVNDTLATVTGYTRSELDSMSLLDLVVPEQRDTVRTQLRQALEENDGAAEITIRTADGTRLPLEVNQSQLLDEAGTPIGVVGIGRDRSSRRTHERNLELQARQQEVVASLGQCALAGVPLDDLFDETVRLVAETLGVEYCKVLQLDVGADRLRLRAGVGWHEGYVGRATVGTETDSQAGYTLLSEEPVVVSNLAEETRFSGPPLLTEHDVASGISVVIGSVEEPWGILGVHSTEVGGFADVDVNFVRSVANVLANAVESWSYRRQLERQNDRLETFADTLSHDLRNPLGVAQGRLELGRQSCDNEHLAAVERAHDRMEEMVDELLAAARDPVGGDSPADVALSDVAEAAWTTVSTGDATLRVDSDGTIEADAGQLQRVFENLFRNAVEHGSVNPRQATDAPQRPGSGLTVRVGTLDDGFYVEDDGRGIADGEHDRIFEEGYTSAEGGSGLGLGIVNSIVAAHGWDIVAVGGRDGGARFEIRFTSTATEL